jgi:hypothetical protein
MKMTEIRVKELYSEGGIILEKRPQEIRFIPRAPLVYPFPGVFKRIANVMEVYINSGGKLRKHVEEKVIDVAMDFRDVG